MTAIQQLQDEIDAIEAEQAPIREQIRQLETQLVDGQQQIARNRAAIEILSGEVSLAPPRQQRRAPLRRTPSSRVDVDHNRIVDFIGAHQPVGAGPIGDYIGLRGNNLTRILRGMAEEGILTYEGEKRARKYMLKTGS